MVIYSVILYALCVIIILTKSKADISTVSPTPSAVLTHNPTPNALLPTAFKTSTPTNKATKKPTIKPTNSDDDDDDDYDHNNIYLEPTVSPTMTDIEDADVDDVSKSKYSFTSKILFICISLALALIFIGLYYYQKSKLAHDTKNSDTNYDISKKYTFYEVNPSTPDGKFTKIISEETSLLKNTDDIQEKYTNSPNKYKVSQVAVPMSPNHSRIYFRASDLDGMDQFTGLMSRFVSIMSNGIVCNLYTTKGPKPILLSLIGYEVRWQSVKSAQKRYKLHLKDIISVEIGKQTRYNLYQTIFYLIVLH